MITRLSFKEVLSKTNAVVRNDGKKMNNACLISGFCLVPLMLAVGFYSQESIVQPSQLGSVKASFLSCLMVFIAFVFSYGLCVHALKTLRSGDARLMDVFAGFGRPFFKIVGVSILLALLLYLCVLCFVMLSGFTRVIINEFTHNPVIASHLSIISMYVAFVVFVFVSMDYSLGSYLIFDERQLSVKGVMKRSRQLTRGTKFLLFGLILFYYVQCSAIVGLLGYVPCWLGWINDSSPANAVLRVAAVLITARFVLPRAIIAWTLYYENLRQASIETKV